MGNNIRITERDMELLKFLAEYKIMSLDNARYVYGTIQYQEKRIVKLVKHGYIKRLKHRYIILGMAGRSLLNAKGIEIRQHCRSVNNMERLYIISDIAAFLYFNYWTNFAPSWQLKNADEPTDHSRRYIGDCLFEGDFYVIYAVYEGKTKRYITSIYHDIRRESVFRHNMIFTNDIGTLLLRKRPYYSKHRDILLIPYDNFSKRIIRNYEKIQVFIIKHLQQTYKVERLNPDDTEFHYLLDDNIYIKLMLFIDTEELEYLGRYFDPGWKHDKNVIVLCLEENLALLQKVKPHYKYMTVSRDDIAWCIKQEYWNDNQKWIDGPIRYN